MAKTTTLSSINRNSSHLWELVLMLNYSRDRAPGDINGKVAATAQVHMHPSSRRSRIQQDKQNSDCRGIYWICSAMSLSSLRLALNGSFAFSNCSSRMPSLSRCFMSTSIPSTIGRAAHIPLRLLRLNSKQ